jgi:alkane 1-monooxygenase
MILERCQLKPHTMQTLRLLALALPLLAPIPLLHAKQWGDATGLHDLFAWWPVINTFVVITLLDYLIGKDETNPEPVGNVARLLFASIPVLSALVYLLTLAWALKIYHTAPWGPWGKLAWLISVGSLSGVLAINVAHELIHKRTRLERWLGGVLLSAVAYGTFKVEHTLGHHAWVGTPRDGSTARRGENVYAFMLRALRDNPRRAVELQTQRLRRQGQGFLSWHNELLAWTLLTLLFAASAYAYAGADGLVFFIAQALVAIAHLECVNYIEHYGLTRRTSTDGQLDRVTPMHSWNSAYFLTNAYLFSLQRHSDHHAHAARRYHALEHHSMAPQLPGGYSAMMVLALLPPLWERVIGARLDAFAAHRTP